MTPFQSIILGIIQGITEFLPVSSSAHLIIVPYFLNWDINTQEAFIFDVLVQVATLLAVIIYFWRDLIQIIKHFFIGIISLKPFSDPLSRLAWFLIIGTLPAVIFGLLVKDWVEQAFASAIFTGIALIINSIVLTLAEMIGKRNRVIEKMSPIDAIWIGIAQALAIFPGISRSGSTIAGGMAVNLERPAAARFSFLLSIPALIGAGMIASLDLLKIPGSSTILINFIPGFITAGIVGYFVIRWLLRYLTNHPLYIFSIYCFFMGIIVLIVNIFRN